MTYDYSIDLIKISESVNSNGEIIPSEIKRTIFAEILTYRTKNYYAAMSKGLQPSITFAVNKYEYENEDYLDYNNKRYKILDVSPTIIKDESEYDSITLICEKVI